MTFFDACGASSRDTVYAGGVEGGGKVHHLVLNLGQNWSNFLSAQYNLSQ